MAGTAITGQFGDVKIGAVQIAEVGKWAFAPKVPVVTYASNKTGGYKQATYGPVEATGTINGYYAPENPITSQIDVGDFVTLKLYIDAVGFYSVPCVIDSLALNVDIETGAFVSWTANYTLNGAYQNPGAGLRMDEHEEDMHIETTRPDQRHPMNRRREPMAPVASVCPAGGSPTVTPTDMQREIANLKAEMLRDMGQLVRETLLAFVKPDGVAQQQTAAAA